MNLQYIVTELKDNKIIVTPHQSEKKCSTCKASCTSCPMTFEVSNSKKFDVKIGDKVKLAIKIKHEVLQSFFALLFPVGFAIIGFIVSNPICALFSIKINEGVKAFFVLAFFIIACAIVLLITHRKKNLENLEIDFVYQE